MTATQGYIAISRRALDLEDYIDVARRHIGWIIGPLFAGLVISIVVAFLWPNTYVSEAVMQITPARVSESLVQTTLTQQLTERIMEMEGNILSRTSLSNLIQSPELNLYPSDRQSKPLEDVIEAMKAKDLKINIQQSIGQPGKHASAFQISFAYSNRFKAQQTVQKLITRFIDENQSSQHTQQDMLKNFFGDETASAKAALEKANEDLTRFRTENQGKLPEQSGMNMAALTSLQNQVSQANDQLNRLAQERVALEAHISTLKSQMDLADLMAQDAPTTSAGSPVARQNEELIQLNKQIESGETQLAQYLQMYKESYPDIRDLRKRLDVLKKQRDGLMLKQEQELADEAKKPKDMRRPTNYQAAQTKTNLQGQIDAALAQMKNIQAEHDYKQKESDRLTKEIEDYRFRLSATAGNEARSLDLQREQKNATEKYQEMLRKSELTAQNNDLIQRKAGEALEVLDPPSLPVNPTRPNRWLWVGGGLAFGLMLGIGMAGIQEAKDTSLKNLKDVRAYTNLPVLCSIPLLENTMLVKRKKRIAYLGWSAAVIIGIIAVCASLFYYYSVTVNS